MGNWKIRVCTESGRQKVGSFQVLQMRKKSVPNLGMLKLTVDVSDMLYRWSKYIGSFRKKNLWMLKIPPVH